MTTKSRFNRMTDDGSNAKAKVDVYQSERRNSKRFDERLHAKIQKEPCSVLNVSHKGILLQTPLPDYYFPLEEAVDFDLQLEDGDWINMKAIVMWVQFDHLNSKIGLFIREAPEPYFNFIKELYE
jgi:PilZ domain